MLKSQRAKLSIKHEIKRFNNVFKHLIKKNNDKIFTFENEDKDDNINDNNDIYFRSDDSIFK